MASTVQALWAGPDELRPGIVLKVPITAGEVHSYRIVLLKNEFFQLVVDQQDTDIEVTYYRPDGDRLQRMDSRWYGSEPAPVIAEVSGDYRLEIRALRAGMDARYILRPEAPRARTALDEISVAAVLASTSVKKLIKEGTLESKKKALTEAQRALTLWKEADDQTGEAQTLNSIGFLQEALSQPGNALASYREALTIWRTIRDRAGEAESLHDIAAAYSALGDKQKALDYYEQALPLRRAVAEHESLAFTLSNMGAVYFSLGEDERATDVFTEALPAWKAAANAAGEAQATMGLGAIYVETGETQKALDAYHRALALTRTAGDHRGEAYCLGNLGKAYDELGERPRALDYLNKAVAAMRMIGDQRGEARALLSAGAVHFSLRQYAMALDLFDRALRIINTVGDRFQQPAALLNIARVRDAMGQHGVALDAYQRTLFLARSVGDLRNQGMCLRNLGETYYHHGDREQALDCFLEARTIFQTVGSRAGEANALLASARVRRDFGQLAQALSDSRTAIEQIESLRTKVGAEELRMSYFASKQSYYRFQIELLMQLHRLYPTKGFDRAALETSERARARGLLDILAEAHTDIRQGIDPGLLETQRKLQRRLDAKAAALSRLPAGKQTRQQATMIRGQMETIVDQLHYTEAKIRATSPRYAALTQPQPLETQDIQKQLDAATMLLEYSHGEEHTFLWAITPGFVKSFELPSPEIIAIAAQRLRQFLMEPDPRFQPCAASVANMLLAPVRGLLGRKRLVIVADGALEYVPFAALPIAPHGPPLAASHETIYLPSASAIAILRSDFAGRRAAPQAIAVFADPVFSPGDERLAEAHARLLRSATSGESTRAGDEPNEGAQELHISRLPFTRQEAKEIASLVPASQSAIYLGFDANRNTATAPQLARYRFVHFATHAFLNNAHPELSGIVLSLVNRQGAQEDGFLRLHDIYNLNLPVELVAVSACQSGLGKEVEGEGLIGLTRGFLYAGAKRVLVSLWKVDDEATAEMMKQFYKALLAKHLRAPAALRTAQDGMRKSARWSSPYYWAGFVIVGEWR